MALVVLPIAYSQAGLNGILAASLAGVLCWVCGAAGLGVVQVFSEPDQVFLQLFFGMIVRMGVPLAACLAFYVIRGPLYDAGIPFYLMAFYAVTLFLDTYFAANSRTNQSAATKVS